MSQYLTPSGLTEIRRVKAMVAGSAGTIDPQCFLGPTGPTGPTGTTGPYGATDFTFVPDNNCRLLTSNSITKLGPVGTAWDSRYYSLEAYPNAAYMTGQVTSSIQSMFGFSTNPTGGSPGSYHFQMNYGFFLEGTNVHIYEHGVRDTIVGTYIPTDTFAIVYDGVNIYYYQNGGLIFSNPRSIGDSLHLYGLFTTNGDTHTNLHFGPSGTSALGSYGLPATLGYYNNTADAQSIPDTTATIVNWTNVDGDFTQGDSEVTYSAGRFTNATTPSRGLLLSVSGYVTFLANATGMRAIYALYGGVPTKTYGYTEELNVGAVDSILSYAFDIYLPSNGTYFELFAFQSSGGALDIHSGGEPGSRISIVQINTSLVGPTGPQGIAGPTGTFSYTGPTGSVVYYDGIGVTGSTGFTYTPTLVSGTGGLLVSGDILPTQNNIFSLGSTADRWREIFIGPGTLNIAGPTVSAFATLGSDDAGIAYTEKGFATPFITIGPAFNSNIAPGAIGGWAVGPTGSIGTSNYDLIAIHTDSNGIIYGPTDGISLLNTNSGQYAPTNICATVFSTSDQPFTANISMNLLYDTVGFAYGITVSTGATSYFQVPSAGVYKIIPSIQILPSNNGDLHIWLKVNNSNVANTTTYLTYKSNEKQVFTTEILLELNANDQVQLWAQSNRSGIIVDYIEAGGSVPNDYPAAPGIIINMYKLR